MRPVGIDLISETAYLQLKIEKSTPATVPAGHWRMLSYSIPNENGREPKSTVETANAEKQGNDARQWRISARGTWDNEPVIVHADQTTTLKFGPPYRLQINPFFDPGEVELCLVLRGANGEVVHDLTVNDKLPDEPVLTITDPQGDVVETGRFEYG